MGNKSENGCENSTIYIIEYTVKANGDIYSGNAVVQASSISQAIDIFKSSSNFNGYSRNIEITRIEECLFGPEPCLMTENYIQE